MINNKIVIRLKKGKLQFCLFLILICFFVFTFYADLVGKAVYVFCIRHVNIEQSNLALLASKTYETEQRFNEEVIDFAESKVRFLKSKGEFPIVKVKGEYGVEYRGDYVLVSDDTVPDRTVKVYLAKNIDIGNNSLPAVTISAMLRERLNDVVLALYYIIFLIMLYKITRCVISATNNDAERFFISATKRIK